MRLHLFVKLKHQSSIKPTIEMSTKYTGWPKKVSHNQFFKKIALKIANEIRFFRKVKV